MASDNALPSMTAPATVSDFRLDKYEITVGRFRAFLEAGMGTQATAPAAGAGAHPGIPGSGWNAAWNVNLATSSALLQARLSCSAVYQTWTDTEGANEALPINCISWFEAMAFCIWDGGYLPTEAEWNYAAAGGSEQRAFPWSSPASSLTTDCTYANYSTTGQANGYCVVNGQDPITGAANRVGSESPKGDGRFGQSDLAGNVFEWVLDYKANYATPCDDCANLTVASERVNRGGSFGHTPPLMRAGGRNQNTPDLRDPFLGARCARPE